MRLAPGGADLWVLCQSPHALVRVALDRFQATLRVKLPAEPVDFDLSSDGSAAAVVFTGAQSVGFLDLTKSGATKFFPAGDDPRAVRFRLDGKLALVANRSAHMLTVLDAKSGATLVRLPLAVEPENFCAKANGGEMYITGKGMDAVVVVYPYGRKSPRRGSPAELRGPWRFRHRPNIFSLRIPIREMSRCLKFIAATCCRP